MNLPLQIPIRIFKLRGALQYPSFKLFIELIYLFFSIDALIDLILSFGIELNIFI